MNEPSATPHTQPTHATPTTATGKSQRLMSLDVLRGLTVMLMIFVNNGAGDDIFPMLKHAKWNGMTLADLVFPFFLFIMGVASYLSLKKYQFEWSAPLVRKIVKRTVLLFAIGLGLNWFHMLCAGNPFDLAHLRVMGVMQRIGLCYGFTSFAVLIFATVARASGTKRAMTGGLSALIAIIIINHAFMLLAYGGFDYDASTNFLAQFDRTILGSDHLYHKSPVDPEGLSSTLAAACNTLIGFLMASLAFGKRRPDTARVALRVFGDGGGLLLVLATLLCGFISLNKRVWSPTYILMTCALAALLQTALIALIDVYPMARKWMVAKGLGKLALIFGTNPLFLYVGSEVVAIVLSAIGVSDAYYNLLHSTIPSAAWASVVYSLTFVALMTLMGYPLWKRRIFIKL